MQTTGNQPEEKLKKLFPIYVYAPSTERNTRVLLTLWAGETKINDLDNGCAQFECSADTRLEEHREAMAVLSSEGGVLWIPQSIFFSSCSIDITHFPFDVQLCELKFGSWTFDAFQLDLAFFEDKAEVRNALAMTYFIIWHCIYYWYCIIAVRQIIVVGPIRCDIELRGNKRWEANTQQVLVRMSKWHTLSIPYIPSFSPSSVFSAFLFAFPFPVLQPQHLDSTAKNLIAAVRDGGSRHTW